MSLLPDARNKLKALQKVRMQQRDEAKESGLDLTRVNRDASDNSNEIATKLLEGLDAQALDNLINDLTERGENPTGEDTAFQAPSDSLENARTNNSMTEPSPEPTIKTSPKKSDSDNLGASLASAGEAVLGIGILSGFGAWGGFQLDQHFHTTPWIAVTLSMLGLGGGLARMVMQALKSESPNK